MLRSKIPPSWQICIQKSIFSSLQTANKKPIEIEEILPFRYTRKIWMSAYILAPYSNAPSRFVSGLPLYAALFVISFLLQESSHSKLETFSHQQYKANGRKLNELSSRALHTDCIEITKSERKRVLEQRMIPVISEPIVFVLSTLAGLQIIESKTLT